MWFTENPWPPILILGLAAAACVGLWFSQRRGAWLLSAATALLAAGAIYAAERQIVTEKERLEVRVVALTVAFQKEDRAAVLAFFARQAADLREIAEEALDRVQVHDDLAVKDMSVELFNEDTQATTVFRANGTITVGGFGSMYHPSRWELRWQKEAGEWKVAEVIRIDPIKGDRIPIFAGQ